MLDILKVINILNNFKKEEYLKVLSSIMFLMRDQLNKMFSINAMLQNYQTQLLMVTLQLYLLMDKQAQEKLIRNYYYKMIKHFRS